MNNSLRVGVFGDSYAAHWKEQQPRTAWACVLEDKFNYNVTNYGFGATSLFWSYMQLLENIDNVDLVILTISQRGRLYIPNAHLQPSGIGTFGTVSHRMTTLNKGDRDYDMFKAAYEYFKYFSNDDFNLYVHKKLISDIRMLCLGKGKKLILIPGFDEDVEFQSTFKVSLGTVSSTECLTNFNKPYLPEATNRTCHMTPINNSILAELLHQIITGTRTTVDINEFKFEKITDQSLLRSQWVL